MIIILPNPFHPEINTLFDLGTRTAWLERKDKGPERSWGGVKVYPLDYDTWIGVYAERGIPVVDPDLTFDAGL